MQLTVFGTKFSTWQEYGLFNSVRVQVLCTLCPESCSFLLCSTHILPVQQPSRGFCSFLSSTEADCGVYRSRGLPQFTWVGRLLPQSAVKMAAKAPKTIYLRVSTLMLPFQLLSSVFYSVCVVDRSGLRYTAVFRHILQIRLGMNKLVRTKSPTGSKFCKIFFWAVVCRMDCSCAPVLQFFSVASDVTTTERQI